MTTRIEATPAVQHTRQEYEKFMALVNAGEKEQIDLSTMGIATKQKEFRRNPDAVEAERQAAEWGARFGLILREHIARTNTMGAYLHPETVDINRLVMINKIYLLLFNIDDRIGNEYLKSLTPAEREQAELEMKAMGQLLYGWRKGVHDQPTAKYGSVQAAWDILNELRTDPLVDQDWLEELVDKLITHFEDATKDHNSDQNDGQVQSLKKFLAIRAQVGGMWITDLLAQFARMKFIKKADREKHHELYAKIIEVRQNVVEIGGIGNELYSFYKEVILRLDELNFIVIAMHENGYSFEEAAFACMDFVNQQYENLQQRSQEILTQLKQEGLEETPFGDAVAAYLEEAENISLATWFWELHVDRYLTPPGESPFLQTDPDWHEAQGFKESLIAGQPSPLHDYAT